MTRFQKRIAIAAIAISVIVPLSVAAIDYFKAGTSSVPSVTNNVTGDNPVVSTGSSNQVANTINNVYQTPPQPPGASKSAQQLADMCDGLAQDIRQFLVQRKLTEPPFFSDGEHPPGSPEYAKDAEKRFAVGAAYADMTRQLFLSNFGSRWSVISDQLKPQGVRTWPTWHAAGRMDDAADLLSLYARRLRDGQVIDDTLRP
jgi:hypothetical protein